MFFQTTVDDYDEIWVDGKLPRKPGETGGPIVAGFNFPDRVERQGPETREGLSDRDLRHQRTDVGHAHELDLPGPDVPRAGRQEVRGYPGNNFLGFPRI